MSAMMNPQLAYRQMLVTDMDAIMAIEPTIYSHPWTRGNFTDSLKSGYSAYVLELQGKIIAYALTMMVLDEAHLLNISVAKAYQGKGYGRDLLAHMIGVAKFNKALNMFLEVRASNKKAIGLYESMGFCEMSIRKGYYPAKIGREDAVLMGLAL